MRLPVNEEEAAFLASLGVENVDYSYEELDFIAESTVADYLMVNGFDENYDVNQIGEICESIIDKIRDALHKSDEED